MWRVLTSLFNWGTKQINVSPNHLIFITGCDSGLGHMLAVYCHSLNMTVVSACHNINSPGARILQDLQSKDERMLTIELDLLKEETMINARIYIENLLKNSNGNNYQLFALVNNAGALCFGEYEWQTWNQIETQMHTNLLGTMRLTKEFIPLLRQQQQKHQKQMLQHQQKAQPFHHSRIINILSHCALQALPKVSPYAASKGGLKCWSDALHMELEQYNINVINFIPGGFIEESNLASKQQQQADEMFKNFSEEQKQFYEDYFKRFNNYIIAISHTNKPNKLEDKGLLRTFHKALTETQPKWTYIYENWRYKFYRLLFQYCPQWMTSWLVDKFVCLPNYEPTQQSGELKKE